MCCASSLISYHNSILNPSLLQLRNTLTCGAIYGYDNPYLVNWVQCLNMTFLIAMFVIGKTKQYIDPNNHNYD